VQENNSFTTSDVAFAKIVPTPTPVSWSQAYHAGKLFAVLSLTKKEAPEDTNALSLLGKEILNILEQEYFVIEDKNLTTIKQAIVSACDKIPSDVTCSFVVGSMIKTALYVFVFGKGKIILKRDDKIGTVLTNDSVLENPEVISASGLLENHDTIVFQTQKFLDVVTEDALSSALNSHDSPSEIAETLTPRVHGQEAGDACAIIVSYVQEEEEKQESEAPVPGQNKIVSLINKLKIIPRLLTSAMSFFPIRRKTEFSTTAETRSKKLFLTIAAILVIVLVASIAFVVKKQNDQKTQALFGKTFESAKTKYDEGQSLLSLNKNLAREDLEEARKILNNAKPKFKKGSKEAKQIEELFKKIEEQLSIASAVNTVEPKQVDAKESIMLSYRLKNDPKGDKGIFLSQDESSIYVASNKEVSVIDKKTEKTKSLFKNDSNWSLGGLGTYLTNVYVLDKKNGIHKFVPTEKEYSKTSYFAAGISPDLSNSSSITVDTSMWILMNDGVILKFTRGKPDSFTVNGLDEPLSKPSRIFTNTDTDNLYILDKGNSRIVVLNKNGDYQSQYKADILKDAIDFDVIEKGKKIFVLSKDKVYEIGIK